MDVTAQIYATPKGPILQLCSSFSYFYCQAGSLPLMTAEEPCPSGPCWPVGRLVRFLCLSGGLAFMKTGTILPRIVAHALVLSSGRASLLWFILLRSFILSAKDMERKFPLFRLF